MQSITAQANMDVASLATAIKVAETSIKLAIPALKGLKEGYSFLKKIVRDDIEDLYDKNEDLRRKARSLKSEFQQTNYRANVFVESVNNVFRYCSQQCEMSAIITEVKEGDFDGLKDFLEKLGSLLSACEENYQLFEEDLKEFYKNANTAAAMCDRLSREADFKKRVTQAGGGTVAAGLLATGVGAGVGAAGVTASVIAGLFTFGIGTAVGLAVTGAAVAGTTAAAGATAAVVTAKTADHYDKLAQGFKRSAEAVAKIQTHASALSNHITTLKDNVDEIGEMADDLNEWYCNASERASICGAIRLLYQTCASSDYV